MATDRINLGRNLDTGHMAFITNKQFSTHMLVCGASGRGKSKFLEYLIREDIRAGKGLALIDPHGYLFQDLIKWLQAVDWPTKKIILLNPSDEQFVTGFNPLKVRLKDLSFHVDNMVQATSSVWGGEDTDKTPLLKRCLRIIFHALAESKLSLLEAQYLTSPVNKNAREYLTKDVQDPIIQEQWRYFNNVKMTPKQFYDEMGSTINRLMEFLAAERIRNILGQLETGLDFRTIMDEGYVLLCNLSSGRSISHDNARMLGALIVNDLFLTATERPPNSRQFKFYIDECGLFINQMCARILDEGRKFGLSLILSNQHLDQLKAAGQNVYKSVLTDAQTKVIFGGLSVEDAEILAQEMYLGEIDLEEPKHILDKPTVVGYTRTWLKNYSEGRSQTWSDSSSESSGTMSSSSSSFGTAQNIPLPVYNLLSMGEMGSETISSVTGSMSGFSQGTGTASGYAESDVTMQGESEALMPILEVLPTETHSLQEQIWKAMNILVNQPSRQAVVKLPGLFTKRIMVPRVEDLPASSDDTIWYYMEKCNKVSPYNKPIEAAREEIETRRQGLLSEFFEYEQAKLEAQKQVKTKQKTRPKI